jgi:anti-sigma factor RsiW
MNNNTVEINEDDLHAYVDKQLPVEKIKLVEALMLKDPKVAQQIHEWQQQNKAIATHFKKIDFTVIPEQLDIKKLDKKTKQQKSKKDTESFQRASWHYSMAASLFFIVIGASAGWFAHDLSQPMTQNTKSFVNSAISAHQVYTVEVIHPVEVSADKKAHLVAWLSKRIDHPLTVPNLQEYGYNLLGGRLLAMREGKPAAQLMFENTEGKRITLLVSKSSSYQDQVFHLKNTNRVNSFYWMDANIAYSITGEMNPTSLKSLSTSVYQQMKKKVTKELASL